MKKIIPILIILLCIISPFSTAKSQYKDLSSFFEGNTAFYSLSNFINSDRIIIVDQKNKIFSTEMEFKNHSKSKNQSIKIVNSTPKEKNYLLLGDYIINENLAIISFADSGKKNDIIYTFKRTNESNQWWILLCISKGKMN